MDELHRLWELLLSKLAEKGMRLQQALVLVQFLRQCDEVLFWINDKEAFVTAEKFGHDLEHVEVLQRKFDEFQKDMASQVLLLSILKLLHRAMGKSENRNWNFRKVLTFLPSFGRSSA